VKFNGRSLSANVRLTEYRQRLAEGLPLSEHLPSIVNCLQQQKLHPLLPSMLAIENGIYFDLTVADSRNPTDVEAFSNSINRQLQKAKAKVGIGRYNENRHCYQSDVFRTESEARTLHIGVDLFVPAMTELNAPLAGRVHSFQNNDKPLDYGPTIILQHGISDECKFFSLYGHLSLCSLDGLYPGKTFQPGEVFAKVGNYPHNGNWPPHVHVQLITDMLDLQGDFPGVVKTNDDALWLRLCPDPDLLLRLPKQTTENLFILADL
jgi:murein DD-endopeptidase MepM/ murein hydrolase activator NlpD